MYEGQVAGSKWDEAGSAQYLCLHNEPEFLQITPGLQVHRAKLYGTEYKVFDNPPAFSNVLHHDAPCSVCYTPSRSTKITIPGRVTCPSAWTREYHGYLMAPRNHSDMKSKMPICVDLGAESVPGSAIDLDGSKLFFIETTCTGIKCPPYSEGAEVACVVCTK